MINESEDQRVVITEQTMFPLSSNTAAADLMKTRLLLDQEYVKSWHQGRRMRKKPEHTKILIQYFNKNPVWDYAFKVRLAEELGMTFN